ncbi:MAG: hypothetical protein H8E66_06060 [Planctomycetes bacterium]|nr:hypothetical protein [Planctomycetota bacterium]
MSSTKPIEAGSKPSLAPSRYDRVASLLISMVILSGSSVAVLVVLWLGTTREIDREYRPPGDGSALARRDSPEPTELETPSQLELAQLALAEPVVELSTLLSHEAIATASEIEIEGPPGDPRPPGDPAPSEDVPRWERWEIRYESSTRQGYARQLDFFGIELGAAGGRPHVDYASELSEISPATRSGQGSDEKRLYLIWRGGQLQRMDRQLLEKAGVDVSGRIVMQFYPQKIEDSLARLEREHTKDGRVDKLRKTIFGVRPTGDGYEFFIIEQR